MSCGRSTTWNLFGALFAIASVYLLVSGAIVGSASAAISTPQTIVGPSANIVALEDVAMSEDGTGGAVYVAVVDGKKHVFAVLFRDGAWSTPMRVDYGQIFDAFSPRIGAANGGRLVVTWIQRGEFRGGIYHDQLFSASLDPGAASFESAVLIDFDVGPEPYVTPDISINAAGAGYIVYRVVKNALADGPIPSSPVSVRIARYNGWLWSRLDQEVNRNAARLMRFPTEDNAPKVVADQFGNAIVAFQEPGDGDESLYSRIWMRRVFGGLLGLPQLASPTSWAGRPLRGDADAISLDGGPLGNAAVAFRQAPGNPPALDRSRVMMNTLPNKFNPQAGVLDGISPVDTVADGVEEKPGAPLIQMGTRQAFDLLFAYDGAVNRATGLSSTVNTLGVIGAEPIGAKAPPKLNLADDGRSTIARVVGQPGAEAVSLLEETASAGMNATTLTSPSGGTIEEVELAGNLSGDSALVLRQSAGSSSTLIAAAVDSAPDKFQAIEPDDWIKSRNPQLDWEPALDLFGAVKYEIRVNGKLDGVVAGTAYRFSKSVHDGRHRVNLTAVDRLGQSYALDPINYRIDRKAPSVRIGRAGANRLIVTLNDGRTKLSSGVSKRSKITWGDRSSSRVSSKKSHKFKKSGRVLVTVKARDKAGNLVTVRRRISL